MCPTHSGRQLALTAEHQNAQQRQTQEEEKNEKTEERTKTQKNAQKHKIYFTYRRRQLAEHKIARQTQTQKFPQAQKRHKVCQQRICVNDGKNCALKGCQYLMESRLLQAGTTLDIPCKRVFERRQNLIKYSRLLYGCILCTNRVVVGGHPKTPNIVKYLFELQTKDVSKRCQT